MDTNNLEATRKLLKLNIDERFAKFVEEQTKIITEKGLEPEMFGRLLDAKELLNGQDPSQIEPNSFYWVTSFKASYKHLPTNTELPQFALKMVLVKEDQMVDNSLRKVTGEFAFTQELADQIKPDNGLDLVDYSSITVTVTAGLTEYDQGEITMRLIDEDTPAKIKVAAVHIDPETGEMDYSELEEGYRIYDFISEMFDKCFLVAQHQEIATFGRAEILRRHIKHLDAFLTMQASNIQSRIEELVG